MLFSVNGIFSTKLFQRNICWASTVDTDGLVLDSIRVSVATVVLLMTHICASTILNYWGRVTHKCVGNLTIIGSDNGLSPDRHQAIIWTNAGILLIGPLGTNFSEIVIEILTVSFKKMRLKVSSAKWRPFCLGLNVLRVNTFWSLVSRVFLMI